MQACPGGWREAERSEDWEMRGHQIRSEYQRIMKSRCGRRGLGRSISAYHESGRYYEMRIPSQTTFIAEARVTIIIRCEEAVKILLVLILVLGCFAPGLQLTTALPHPKKGLFRTELV